MPGIKFENGTGPKIEISQEEKLAIYSVYGPSGPFTLIAVSPGFLDRIRRMLSDRDHDYSPAAIEGLKNSWQDRTSLSGRIVITAIGDPGDHETFFR